MGVRAPWHALRRPERWTIKQSADFIYREVLRERGFRRTGNRFFREDFLRREVSLHAARWLPAHKRRLEISFSLQWGGLPDGLASWPLTNLYIGGSLQRSFLQPRVDAGRLNPRVVELVRGPVLDYLSAPTSPEDLIDALLTLPGLPMDARCTALGGSTESAEFAVWGAVLLGDANRCARALELVRVETADGSERQLRLIQDVDAVWRRIHGASRPGPRA